jgi:broad specificity phosphatase PhoE
VNELIFVRHAATAWSGLRYCGRTDLPLSPAGRAAAERLARRLAAELPPGPSIVTSGLLRARQTADVIARALGAEPPAVDDRWRETDFGVAEGLTFAELERAAPTIAASLGAGDFAIDWPAGERHSELAGRVAAALAAIAGRPGATIVVAHGGPLRHALALASGVPLGSATPPDPGTEVRLPVRLAV